MDETGRFPVGPTYYTTDKHKHIDVYIDGQPVTLTQTEYNKLVLYLYDQVHRESMIERS